MLLSFRSDEQSGHQSYLNNDNLKLRLFQCSSILALLFQNDIEYDIVACNSNSNAYKNQQIFAFKGVINFQMEFGLADIEKWTKSNFMGR